jgi:TP901 family phage tail tape measure protein
MPSGGVRDAILRIKGDDSALDGALSTSRAKLGKFAKTIGGDIKAGLSKAFESLKTIGGFAGVVGIAAAANDIMSFEKGLTRLGIQARRNAGDMAKLRAQIYQLGSSTGADPDKILGGVTKFVELTGDIDTATNSMALWTRVAQGSGSSMEDIASTAAALSKNMGIGADQAERAFNVMLSQGKTGAVELRDLSTLAAGLTPQFATFGTKGVAGLAEMGALLQDIRPGFGSAEEAATGLSSLMEAIPKKAKFLKHAGVNPFTVDANGVKHLRDLKDIAFELLDKTKGDPQKLEHILGRAEAYRAILALQQAGKKNVEDLIQSGLTSNEVQADFARYTETAAGKMDKLRAQLKETFSKTLAGNLDHIVDLMKMLTKLLDVILSHPELSLAAFGALKFGPGLANLFAGGGATGAGVAGSVMGGAPVYVVNMPGAGMAGAGAAGAAGAAGGAGGKPSATANMIAGVTGGFFGSMLGIKAADWFAEKTGANKATSEAVGGIGGGILGVKAGTGLLRLLGAGPLGLLGGNVASMAYLIHTFAQGPHVNGNVGAGKAMTQSLRTPESDPNVAAAVARTKGGTAPDMDTVNANRLKLATDQNAWERVNARGQSQRELSAGALEPLIALLERFFFMSKQDATRVVLDLRTDKIVADLADDRDRRRRP